MDYKELFLKDIKSISREGMDKLIDWIENKSDFFTAPASTKFHLAKEGGLCEHSYLVAQLIIEKANYWRNKNTTIFIPKDDSLKLVALTHDLCKCNFYQIGIRNVKENGTWVQKNVYEVNDKMPLGHGEKTIAILQSFIQLTGYEMLMIRWHMGCPNGDYANSQAYHKALELYPCTLLLHTTDYESSYLLEEVVK